jgi:glutathione S-transferase
MSDTTDGREHQLLGLYDSPFVRRVAVTMQFYGIPYAHVSLSVFRHMDAMRPLNPLFKVPMLTLPNGETLYESAYQLDYLDELAAGRGISPLTPLSGRQWPEWSSRLRGQMNDAFGMLEERLSGDFLVAGRLTQADISAVAGIGFVRHVLPHEWPTGQYPALEGLAARLEASASFLAVPIDA